MIVSAIWILGGFTSLTDGTQDDVASIRSERVQKAAMWAFERSSGVAKLGVVLQFTICRWLMGELVNMGVIIGCTLRNDWKKRHFWEWRREVVWGSIYQEQVTASSDHRQKYQASKRQDTYMLSGSRCYQYIFQHLGTLIGFWKPRLCSQKIACFCKADKKLCNAK